MNNQIQPNGSDLNVVREPDKSQVVEVGDIVRFVVNKRDDDGWQTDKVMRVTGRCVLIETDHNEQYGFPKTWVRRSGIDYWCCTDNIQVLEKGKRVRKYKVL
jgi:hypothetical protein